MGYYARYKIETDAFSPSEVIAQLEERTGGLAFRARGGTSTIRAIESVESISWYEWEEHVRAIARLFLGFGFAVTVQGEDGWSCRVFFKGDEIIKVKPTFPAHPEWFPFEPAEI